MFDGHGPFGHMVAKKVRDTLPQILCTQWTSKSDEDQSSLFKMRRSRNSNSEDSVALDAEEDFYKSLEAEENEKFPKMFLPLKVAILESFKMVDKELKLHPKIDSFCSGSTGVTLIKQVILHHPMDFFSMRKSDILLKRSNLFPSPLIVFC